MRQNPCISGRQRTMSSRPCFEQRTKLLKEFVLKKMIGNFPFCGTYHKARFIQGWNSFYHEIFSFIPPNWPQILFVRPSVHVVVNSSNCRPQSKISCALRILSTASEVPWDVMHKGTRTCSASDAYCFFTRSRRLGRNAERAWNALTPRLVT